MAVGVQCETFCDVVPRGPNGEVDIEWCIVEGVFHNAVIILEKP